MKIYNSILCFTYGAIFSLILFSRSPQKGATISGNAIANIKDSVERINSGGCGYFAMKLYERLDSTKYSIVIINDGNHVAIMEDETGYFIDANGYRDKLSYQLRYPGKFAFITYDSLKRLVSNVGFWNKGFNRKDTVIINRFISLL